MAGSHVLLSADMRAGERRILYTHPSWRMLYCHYAQHWVGVQDTSCFNGNSIVRSLPMDAKCNKYT